MKYTIELTEGQKRQMDLLIEMAHKHVGFTPKLKMETPIPMTESPAYKKGFEDGKLWAINENAKDHQGYYDNGYNNALEDVNHAMTVLENMTETEREEWFTDCASVGEVVHKITIQGIIRCTKAYEEKKKVEEEIKVGDEVETCSGARAVVTRIIDNCVRVMFHDGSGFREQHTINELKKTGRHFDEVEQLLDKLRGEGEQ